MTLTVKRMGRWWWITGYNAEDWDGPIGPYDTKAEGESDARGIRRFIRYHDEPGFMTSDPPKGEER